ncbi:MAG TPA: peptidoglycan DD-metalloendopeptidase family protein [Candidatus Paceibacterota bacterium]|nr:peptidoglycan DD-metalloendopeptidase family protein [Candidatus Paceibacterota bacterium]
MKAALSVAFLFCLLVVTQADAQTTAYYQLTPFPLKKSDGSAMPQDLEKIHLWDGWLPSYYYGQTLQRDDKLQMGGWGDVYETYIKFDLNGLPANPSAVTIWFKAYNRGDSSTTTPLAFCKVGGSWNLSLTWSARPSFLTCAGWFDAPIAGGWWGVDFTPWYAEWKNGTVTNNGIALSPEYNNNNFDVLRSSRYTTNDGDRPYLEFTFTQPSGMPSFKMPVPGGAKWLLTNEIGGYECMGESPWPDPYHQGSNYYAIDISPTNVKDGGGSYTGNIPVIAAAGGYVKTVSYTDANGYYVVIDHDGDGNLGTGFSTRYLHLQSNVVVVQNSTVAQGDLLGYMGNTGNPTTGTHLHFGIRYADSGSSSVSQLSYVVMDGWLMKSFQTECAVNSSGVPTSRIRYYHSTNRTY